MPVQETPKQPRVFERSRRENWPDNKSEYYGRFIKALSGSDTKVNVTTDAINIDTSAGKSLSGGDEWSDHVIFIESETEAKSFLAFLQDMDQEAFDIIKNIDFK